MNESGINNIINSDENFKNFICYTNGEFIVSGFDVTNFFEIIQFIKTKLDANKKIKVNDGYTKSGTRTNPITSYDEIDISPAGADMLSVPSNEQINSVVIM